MYKLWYLGWGSWSRPTLWLFNCSSTICWKGYLSFIKLLLHLCQKSNGILLWVYCCVSVLFPCSMCLSLCYFYTVLIAIAIWQALKSVRLISLSLFFKIVSAILISLPFHINFSMFVYKYRKYNTEILIKITLNLYISFGRIGIFTM